MMAILDRRLIPLIEALTDANADWLAFEIVDGVQLGRVEEETQDLLQSTRNTVRGADRPTRLSKERASPPPATVPIVGDEQIDWAADYVSKRMSDAVMMLEGTLDQLDAIVSGTSILDEASSPSTATHEITVVLQTDDQKLSVRRGEAANARTALPKLQEALQSWVASTRNGGPGE
jgi:hypothetical protein